MIGWLLWMGCAEPDCSLNEDIVGDDIDQNCDGRDGVDQDGDGQASLASGGIDCDDNNIGVLAMQYYLDADQDGWGSNEQVLWLCPEDIEMGLQNDMLVERGDDCDDNHPNVHPDAHETCDGIDNDCNGAVDSADERFDITSAIRLYADQDGDGWGSRSESKLLCDVEDGWVLNNRDCDDSDIHNACWDDTCVFGLCDQSITVGNTQLDFSLIQAGTGVIGSTPEQAASEPEETRINISIEQDFWMLTTPVTQAIYQAVTGYTPSMFASSLLCQDQGQCPVETVSWHEAAMFSNLLTIMLDEPDRTPCYTCNDGQCLPVEDLLTCRGVRLPTEYEWEYAARSGTASPFWTEEAAGELNDTHISNEGCGREWFLENGARLEDYGWFCANNVGDFEDPFYGTKPVALRQPNAFGLFDMIGGIWEMTTDQYIDDRPFTNNLESDPYFAISDTLTQSVVRKGGMWGDPPSDLRAARREPVSLDYQNGDVGFRVVMLP